jgi:hypothetical protein
MGIEIRAARPEDSRFLAWAVVESARSHLVRGFWDLWIPDDDARRTAFVEKLLLAERASLWHWTLFHIAEIDGEPAATLSGCDPTQLVIPDAAVGEVMAASGWSEAEGAAAVAGGAPGVGGNKQNAPRPRG